MPINKMHAEPPTVLHKVNCFFSGNPNRLERKFGRIEPPERACPQEVGGRQHGSPLDRTSTAASRFDNHLTNC